MTDLIRRHENLGHFDLADRFADDNLIAEQIMHLDPFQHGDIGEAEVVPEYSIPKE
jgi:hypothetical protein